MFHARLSALLLCIAALQTSHSALAADTPEPCKLSKVADLSVTVTPRNAILVAGSIKGEDVLFQIDTGASITMFDNAVFSRFGVLNAGDQYRMIGVGGESHGNVRTTIPGLKIGDYNGGDMRLLVSSTHFLSDGVYALIGEDLLELFDLEIDLAKNKITLFEHNSCSSEPIYWADSFSEADLSVRDHKLFITLELDGKPVEAALDTGASTSIISTAITKRMGIDENSPGMTKAGFSHGIDQHRVDVYKYRFSELKIGDEVIKNPLLNVANLAPVKHAFDSAARMQDDNLPDLQALLGADFVKTHHIYIATRNRKMYFTYNGGGIFSPPRDQTAAATK
jgi:predicted aspartyl protease